MRPWYEVLEVAPDADAATVKAAFRRKALTHHPDREPHGRRFQEVNEAYGTWLGTQPAPATPPTPPPSDAELQRMFEAVQAKMRPPPPVRSRGLFVWLFLSLVLTAAAWLLAR